MVGWDVTHSVIFNFSANSFLTGAGPPSLSSLLGAADGECSSLSSLGKTEVCLVLSPAPGKQTNSLASDIPSVSTLVNPSSDSLLE
jgi:hypothetical protein